MTSSACPKCSGTGVIPALAHVKDGVCFDCNGLGTIAGAVAHVAPQVGVAGMTGIKAARIVADAVLAGESVARADVDAALETLAAIIDNRHSHVVRVRALQAARCASA